MQKKLLLLAIFGFTIAETSVAVTSCVAANKAKYEAMFCEVQATRFGRNLPSMADFRQNTERMQYLLLKRSAQSLGIHLPLPSQISLSGQKALKSVKKGKFKVGKEPVTLSQPRPFSCVYYRDNIKCANEVYRLQLNKVNRELSEGALLASNKLLLPSGADFSTKELYWAEAYTRYIKAMLSIGLAGSSFTYTAFVYMVNDHQKKRIDSATRFQEMFRLLKSDKRNLSISRRAPERAPEADECDELNEVLIVCDSQGMNLVYWSLP